MSTHIARASAMGWIGSDTFDGGYYLTDAGARRAARLVVPRADIDRLRRSACATVEEWRMVFRDRFEP